MKFLTTHSTSRTGYYLCLFMQTQFLVSCIHTCTNETHSVANLQDLIPTLASKFVLPIIIAAKVGIKSCRFATECVSFVHVWMQLANQLELCLHEQTQIVAIAARRVGSQEFHSWIASLPLVSLLLL